MTTIDYNDYLGKKKKKLSSKNLVKKLPDVILITELKLRGYIVVQKTAKKYEFGHKKYR